MKYNLNFDKNSNKVHFSVPNGYFDDFNRRIDLLITPKKTSLFEGISSYIYVAATFAIILSTAAFLFINNKQNQAKINQQNRATAEYNRVVNEILIEETNEDVIVDYIIAEAN